MATTLTFTSAPFLETTVFAPADTTVAKNILTVDNTYARRVYGISVFTDDTTPKDITIQLTNPSGTSFILTTISIAANAGNTNARKGEIILLVDSYPHSFLCFFQRH